MVNPGRRMLLLGACGAGCAADVQVPADTAAPDHPLLSVWRTVQGAYIGAASTMPAAAVRPTGMFVRWVRPESVALRGSDLLVADLATTRIWRVDVLAQTQSALAGVLTAPGTVLSLGADLSAWVLDPGTGQILRFGREGRLVQTFRAGLSAPSPSGFVLADGGATLLLADGVGAQWVEQRGSGGLTRTIRPVRIDGLPVSSVDAIALGREDVYVLDRLAGVVHRTRRDGQAVSVIGRGELMQPVALAVDRFERVYVADHHDQSLKVFQAGLPMQRLDRSQLGLRQLGGLAADGAFLAICDPLAGQVVIYRLGGVSL